MNERKRVTVMCTGCRVDASITEQYRYDFAPHDDEDDDDPCLVEDMSIATSTNDAYEIGRIYEIEITATDRTRAKEREFDREDLDEIE